MPKVSDKHRAERHGQILRAARLCFHEKGLHATGMDDIIGRSGLSAGAVYGYFRGKEELMLAACDAAMAEVHAGFAPLLAGPPAAPADFMRRALAVFNTPGEAGTPGRLVVQALAEAPYNARLRARLKWHCDGLAGQLQAVADFWSRPAGIRGSATDSSPAALLAEILGALVLEGLNAAPDDAGASSADSG